MKFKVGQKVRVKEDLVVGRMYGEYRFTAAMAKYRGKTYSISDIVDDYYCLKECKNMTGDCHWKFTDEMLGTVKFTKADLETGMVVEYRDGDRRLVINDYLYGFDCWMRISSYDDSLLCLGSPGLDIMRVYRINVNNLRILKEVFELRNLELIWERQEESEPEVEEMTLAEIEKELGRKIKIVSEE